MDKPAAIPFAFKNSLGLRRAPGSSIYFVAKLLFMLSVFFNAELNAQPGNYYISHFTSENGLPQNSIKGIETDKKGYIWLATEVGLARYDGRHFRLYNQLNTPVLKGDRIVRIGMLPDSSIFIEGYGNNFYQVTNSETLAPFMPNPETKRKIDSFSIFKATEIYDSCKLRVITGKAPGWIMPYLPFSRSLSISLKYIRNQYFYFNDKFELISADPQFKHFNKVKITGVLSARLNSTGRDSAALSLLSNGNQLYVRFGDWIYYLNVNKQTAIAESSRFLQVDSIPNITYFRSWPDLNLNLVGTISDGLYIFKKQLFFNRQFKNVELNVFSALVPFGVDGVFTKAGVLSPGKVIRIKSEGITTESMLQDKDGHYFINKWVSENESGIAELNSQLQQLRFIPEYNLHVRCFRQLNDGKVWFSDDVHFLGKIENNKLIYINRPAKLPADFNISCFIRAEANGLWIAGAGGLAQIDSSGKLLQLIPELVHVNIRCLYRDSKGTIWIGSYGKGFYALHNNRLVVFPMDKNKYLVSTHSFLEDQNGYMWITTNNGLFQASVKELYHYLENPDLPPYYYRYDQSDGFLTNEFNGGCNPSGIKLTNGEFCFPSIKSLVQFYPDSVKPLLPEASVNLDAILADTANLNVTLSSFSLPKKINRLQFFVSSPYFGHSYNQTIEYQLNGLDSNWYPVNEDGIININKLPSGKYHLVLRKKAGFGVNNYVVEERSFTVQPAFYETWIFKGLLTALAIILFYFFYKLRIRFFLNQKKLLENEVHVRTSEQKLLIESLENAIIELEESKEQLYQNNLFKERLAMIIMHDLQSPLRFLFDATRRVHEKYSRKQYSELNEITSEVFRATGKIYNFVNDFGWWLSTMGEHFKLQTEAIDLPVLLTELNQFFMEQLKAKGNSIVLSPGGIKLIDSDRQLLKIILRNIIDNANKHTLNSTIEIKTTACNGMGIIIITDSGFGMDNELLAKLKLRLKEKTIDYSEKETGFGYRFISDLSKLMDINVEIESKKGEGTTVTLSNLKISSQCLRLQ